MKALKVWVVLALVVGAALAARTPANAAPLVSAAILTQPPTTAPANQTAVGKDPQNATYLIEGQPVTLVNGTAEQAAAPGSAAKQLTRYFGNAVNLDLNGDGRVDSGFLVTQERGGSGVFYYAAAALNTVDGYLGTNTILLGDRIAPQSTTIDPHNPAQFIVNYADRPAGAPMTSPPTVGVSRTFKVDNGALVEVVAPPAPAPSDQRCFPETGQCISGPIRTFWEQNGGLPVFGYPITPQRPEPTPSGTFESQWFERTRLELHPENAPPYDVLLGRAGDIRLQQQGRDWTTFPKADTNNLNVPGGCVYFSETQHSVCGVFLTAYRRYGLNFPGVGGISSQESLALFGLPLSEPMNEVLEDGQQHTVQWFERARFEEHPANQPPYNVLYGRLGAEILSSYLSSPGNKPPVVGTVWRWEGTTLSDGSRMAANDPSRYTLEFHSDGTVTVKADCNQVAGAYTLKGSSLTITLGPSTLAACPPDSQADVYLQQLGTVVSYAYDSAGSLILNMKMDSGNMRFIP